jgi:hypothetical protein
MNKTEKQTPKPFGKNDQMNTENSFETALDEFERFAHHEAGCARYRALGKDAQGWAVYGNDDRFCSCGYMKARNNLVATQADKR